MVVKNGHIMTFSDIPEDLKAYDMERNDFAQLLERVVIKEQKMKEKLITNKKARIPIDSKRFIVSSVIFPAGKKKFIIQIC